MLSFCEHYNELSVYTITRVFLHQLNEYQLLKSVLDHGEIT
jgi:hypothetical protein